MCGKSAWIRARMGAREEGEWSEKEEQEEAREDSENGARLKRDCGEISTRSAREWSEMEADSRCGFALRNAREIREREWRETRERREGKERERGEKGEGKERREKGPAFNGRVYKCTNGGEEEDEEEEEEEEEDKEKDMDKDKDKVKDAASSSLPALLGAQGPGR